MMFFEGDIGAPPTITVCSEEAAAILALPVSALAAQPIRPAATTLIPITFVKAFMGAILCFGARAIPRSPGLRRRAAESFRSRKIFAGVDGPHGLRGSGQPGDGGGPDRKSTRLNSSH